jgi:hypothetical protein
MVLLTIDTRGTLREGLVISPGDGSELDPLRIMRNYSVREQAELELNLELARQVYCPDRPSRQSCLFACDSWERLKVVSEGTNRRGGLHGKVYEVFGQACGPFDSMAAWTRWIKDAWVRALMYWDGFVTADPVFEYLIALPVRIGRQVGTLQWT